MPTVCTTRQNTQAREARIRLRAEELYGRRGNLPGSALDDWLLAEKEIREDEEHAIDEALQESFPASDPSAHSSAGQVSIPHNPQYYFIQSRSRRCRSSARTPRMPRVGAHNAIMSPTCSIVSRG